MMKMPLGPYNYKVSALTSLAYVISHSRYTRYEVDSDTKIGVGFFSDVYKATWRGRIVAIRGLAGTTPRKLSVREIGIWKTLHHPNVLGLYGAQIYFSLLLRDLFSYCRRS